MRGVVACAVALVACHANGVEIIVNAPPGGANVDTVMLYLGVPKSSAVTVQPQGGYEMTGTAWQHDALDDLSCGSTDAPCRFPARFTYEPGATNQLGEVIAVGTLAGTIVAASHTGTIPLTGGVARATMDLDAVDVVYPPSQAGSNATAARVEVWHAFPSSPNPDETCALFGEPASGAVSFVSYASTLDPDCDGYLTGTMAECDPNHWMGGDGPHTLADITCATTTSIMTASGSTPACVLGGPSCFDGQGPVTCGDSGYCVPLADCSTCASDPNGIYTCLQNMLPQFRANKSFPHIECDVPYDTVTMTLCASDGTIPLNVDNQAWSCSQPLITDGSAPWAASFSSSGVTASISIHAPCTVDLNVPLTRLPTVPADVFGLLSVVVDNGNGTRGGAIPIDFKTTPLVTGTCSPSAITYSCAFKDTYPPDFATCVSAPVPPNPSAGG